MVSCSICGKEFKTPQALNGHVRFKHGTQPAATRVTEPAATPVPPEATQSDSESAIAQMLEQLDDRIGRAAQDVIRGIPGVPEAIAFAKAMSDRGKDYGWNQVTDVEAAIDQHLVDTRQIEPEKFLDALGIAVKRVSQKVE